MKTQLVIMAAGIGSRFGEGIKQLTPIGKNGEIIMDYSIAEAIKAGFDEVIVIIRKDIEKEFKEVIGNRLEKKVKLIYAYQELDMLPEGFKVKEGRIKPYGTAHAIYAAKEYITSPFMVINADDYYGVEGFKKIHEHLITHAVEQTGMCPACDHRLRMSMAGFIIGNTLSENGAVTRGICKQDENGFLTDVVETYDVKRYADGKIRGKELDVKEVTIDDNALVSMNMFGFPFEFIFELEGRFIEFLEKHGDDIKSEFLLPQVVNDIIKEGRGTVHVCEVHDKWYGVTYKEDKEYVKKALCNISID